MAVHDDGSSPLVDNMENLEASNSTSILGRLTLCIIEDQLFELGGNDL